MAYVPVPKDLTKVKSKFLFGLTKRQVVCFGIGALIGVPMFFLTKNAFGTSLSAMLMIVIMLPFFLLAMFERHGQPLEAILKQIIEARFLRPKKRVYATDNFYAAIDRDVRLKKDVNKNTPHLGKASPLNPQNPWITRLKSHTGFVSARECAVKHFHHSARGYSCKG